MKIANQYADSYRHYYFTDEKNEGPNISFRVTDKWWQNQWENPGLFPRMVEQAFEHSEFSKGIICKLTTPLKVSWNWPLCEILSHCCLLGSCLVLEAGLETETMFPPGSSAVYTGEASFLRELSFLFTCIWISKVAQHTHFSVSMPALNKHGN